jgi:hypothetical protein
VTNIALHTQRIFIDREVIAKWPDMITKNKKQKPCKLIEVEIPADAYVTQKEGEKINK